MILLGSSEFLFSELAPPVSSYEFYNYITDSPLGDWGPPYPPDSLILIMTGGDQGVWQTNETGSSATLIGSVPAYAKGKTLRGDSILVGADGDWVEVPNFTSLDTTRTPLVIDPSEYPAEATTGTTLVLLLQTYFNRDYLEGVLAFSGLDDWTYTGIAISAQNMAFGKPYNWQTRIYTKVVDGPLEEIEIAFSPSRSFPRDCIFASLYVFDEFELDFTNENEYEQDVGSLVSDVEYSNSYDEDLDLYYGATISGASLELDRDISEVIHFVSVTSDLIFVHPDLPENQYDPGLTFMEDLSPPEATEEANQFSPVLQLANSIVIDSAEYEATTSVIGPTWRHSYSIGATLDPFMSTVISIYRTSDGNGWYIGQVTF